MTRLMATNRCIGLIRIEAMIATMVVTVATKIATMTVIESTIVVKRGLQSASDI